MTPEPTWPPLGPQAVGRDRWITRGTLSKRGPSVIYRVGQRSNPAGDHFALKELRAKPSTLAVKRFLQEIALTRALAEKHPGIVPVIDYGGPEEGEIGSPWYVMPLAERSLEGETEYAHNLDAVLELGISLADTLAIVHAQTPRIVHRDLKPANLLQMSDGHVQIADFGIAYLDDPDGDRLTGDRAQIVGTRPFIAPELLKRGPVTGIQSRNDIYSLGKTLYAILAGGTVFEREDHRADGVWLTQLTGDQAYEHFHGLLDRMVTARPEDRFPDMAAVKQAFERARRAVAAQTTYTPGFYGTAETPGAMYRTLDAVLSGQGPGRRRWLVGATDRAIEFADAHIRATTAPDLQPWQNYGPDTNDKGVAAHCGEFLLAAGAALLFAEEDEEAHSWVARVAALLKPGSSRVTRREMILHDAAAYALVAAGGIAWRHASLAFLGKIVEVYREHYHSIIYLPLVDGHSTRSAQWMAATLAVSTVLAEAEPWVAAQSDVVVGLVSGLALLTRLGWMSVADRSAIADDAANFDDYPALIEPFWGWFSLFGQRCREAPTFAQRLGTAVPITSEGDLRKACARLHPLLDQLIHARYLRQHRDVQLWFVDEGGEWHLWLGLQ